VIAPAPAAGGVQTVRRVITYLLLFTMVVIAAIGLSGLLERVLDLRSAIAASDSTGLAQSLAFSLIAGPLAATLWWLTWRDSASTRDRSSVAWPVYLVIASTVALLTFTLALFSWATALVAGEWQPSSLAVAIVWALVWLWHYWMWRHPSKGPTRLPGAAPAIASFLGLTMMTGGLVFALASLIDTASATFAPGFVSSGPAWQPVLQSLVWAVGGGLLWGWHWFRAGVREQQTGFANVLLVWITGLAAFALFAVGVVLVLYVVLRLLIPSDEPLVVTLDSLGIGVASAAIGALVTIYHTRSVARQADAVGAATRLVTSGVALAIAATGVGVTVNALLGSLGTQLVGSDFRDLLLGGLSALLVGGALWWAAWRPGRASSAERAATPGRRVYLVVIFGASALVALVTLLVIGFQVFSFALGEGSGESFLDRSRQALGLLVATVLVAAYHFALWRGDRAAGAAPEHVRTIERVTLVASGDPEPIVAAIREATGARVAVLRRADAVAGEAGADALVGALVGILDDGAVGGHVLLVAGGEGKAEVIRLSD
jgi:hypothetical protein